MLNDICQIFKIAYERGWITPRDGNASFKSECSGGSYHVTPSGVRKDLLQERMMVEMSLYEQDKMIKDSVYSPTGELPMHFLLQKDFKEDRVVIHLHPTYTIAAMHKGIDLIKLSELFPELRRYTNVAPSLPAIEPVSVKLALAVVQNIGLEANGSVKYDIVGLDKHGVVSVAADAWTAFEHIERLEHICKIALI
jgi:L-fuculose-phosphate aldolase